MKVEEGCANLVASFVVARPDDGPSTPFRQQFIKVS